MRGPRRRRGRLLRVLWGVQLGLSAFAILGILFSPISLFTHFQVHAAVAWSAWFLLLRLVPRAGGAFWNPGAARVLALGLLVLHAGVVLWALRPLAKPDLEQPDQLTVLWYNVKHDPEAVREAEELVGKDPPDIVCLGEVSPDMEWRLPGYAFLHRAPKGDVLIASRYPLEAKRVFRIPEGREILSAEVVVERRRFTLLVAHVRTPVRSSHRPALAKLASLAAAEERCVLVGDLNTTPWSAEFRPLEEVGGLRHARRGRGYLASWGMLPGKPMRLPIDHALVKGPIVDAGFALLPWMRSDHRGFLVELEVGGPRFRRAAGDD